MQKQDPNEDANIGYSIQVLVYLVILMVFCVLFLVFQVFNTSGSLFPKKNKLEPTSKSLIAEKYLSSSTHFWTSPELSSIAGSGLEEQILYGREIIIHTAKYFGPKGKISNSSNGMNCQNCHLDAGTKIYGNNYGSVASTYPKFRARSGKSESIYKRINDCFERSLNGSPLDSMSQEMQAMKAYILFLGKNVEHTVSVKGSGLKNMPFLDRAADPINGSKIYDAKCASCHGKKGEGIILPDGSEYIYPPLWGKNSYNDGAGLYRLSNFAKYVKYNMPLGATYDSPQLTDEESWDVSAFVNTQLRPHKEAFEDWPNISKKPIDHAFGPYIDTFSEKQHKLGPFSPITEFRNQPSKK